MSAQWKDRRNFQESADRRRICQRGGERRGEGSMADRNRRYTLAAIALPFLLIAVGGVARANTIVVNTLDSGTQPFPLCTLEDAVIAANTQAPAGGCPAGTGNLDTIQFIITGSIFTDNTLTI